jgi:hypothetical protein
MSALRRILGCVVVIGLAGVAHAGGVRGVGPDGKKGWLHTVEKGDTLWDITETYLGSPWIWPSVWKDNDDIQNPHRISPGDRLWISETEMRKLTDAEVAQIALESDAPAALANQDAAPGGVLPTAPHKPPANDPFAALDRSGDDLRRVIRFPGLHRYGYLTPEELSGSAAVLGSHDENYWSSQERRTIVGVGEGKVHIGDYFTVFRTRRRVTHPETGVVLGYQVDILGTAEVTEIHVESSFVRVASSYAEIEPGDRVMPYREEASEFVAVYDGKKQEGVVVGMPIYRQYALNGDMIVIDRGSDDGVVVGNEFELFRAGKEVLDPVNTTKTLVPDDLVGRVMVLKPGNNSSLALLTRADRPIRVGDHFRNLP